MADPRELQRRATRVTSAAMLVLGIAIVVRTLAAGGSAISIGLVLGVLFVLAGGGRFYLAGRR